MQTASGALAQPTIHTVRISVLKKFELGTPKSFKHFIIETEEITPHFLAFGYFLVLVFCT